MEMDRLAAWLGVPGLTFRPVRGEEDYALIADVFNRSNEADGLDYVVTVEQAANRFAHRTDFDPRRDTILAEMGGEPIGYGEVGWRRETEGAWIYRAPLPPGLEIRPVRPEHYRAVWEALVEAFRDHWGHSEPKEGQFQRWLEHPHFAPGLWQVAWDGDQVAGVSINWLWRDETP